MISVKLEVASLILCPFCLVGTDVLCFMFRVLDVSVEFHLFDMHVFVFV